MGLNINTTGVNGILLGSSNEIHKVYVGTTLVYERTNNIFVFEVGAGDTITLQNDTRGAIVVPTNWGDGTIDNNLSHTYSTAGRFTVTTNYSINTINGQGNYVTRMCLDEVLGICNGINNIDYLFDNCSWLQFRNINFGSLDISKFDSAVCTFSGVASVN